MIFPSVSNSSLTHVGPLGLTTPSTKLDKSLRFAVYERLPKEACRGHSITFLPFAVSAHRKQQMSHFTKQPLIIICE